MKALKIIGIETRTSNKNALQDLGTLWNRFFAEQISSKITNAVDDTIYAVYTDYESDYNGMYTTIIGKEVTDFAKIPIGFISREFSAQISKTFIAKGKLPDAVGTTWAEIWKENNNLNRSYLHDIEVYGQQSQNLENGIVEIMIGVK